MMCGIGKEPFSKHAGRTGGGGFNMAVAMLAIVKGDSGKLEQII